MISRLTSAFLRDIAWNALRDIALEKVRSVSAMAYTGRQAVKSLSVRWR